MGLDLEDGDLPRDVDLRRRRPTPSYSRMVSTMSSMNRWVSGLEISAAGTGSATRRSTGCPRRATFRIAMRTPL
jgi:hypothetical protein